MHRIYFIRHAESSANRLPFFNNAGKNDPLTKIGILQAKRTAELLSALTIQAVYSSPIQRAIETANILSTSLENPIHPMPGFSEFNLGELEGQPRNEANILLHQRVLDAWMDGMLEESFPKGDSGQVFIERFSNGVKQVIGETHPGNLVVVCHGGHIIFGLKAICPDSRLKLNWKAGVKNCSITIAELGITHHKLKGRVLKWVDTSHLAPDLLTR